MQVIINKRYNRESCAPEVHSDIDLCQPDNTPSLATLIQRAQQGVVVLQPVTDDDFGHQGVAANFDTFSAMDAAYDLQNKASTASQASPVGEAEAPEDNAKSKKEAKAESEN